jgi:hypothetical protein
MGEVTKIFHLDLPVLISKVKVVEFPTKIDLHFLGDVNTALRIA